MMAENKNNKGGVELEHRGSVGGWFKERWRKFLVSLKRRPQNIPMVALVVAFLYYSLNLMHVSDTTARIQGSGMGLAGFATMLFSMLSFMCFLNAFPYRKKPVMPMVILMFVMLGIVIFADAYYISVIVSAVTRADNPIKVTANTMYINSAYGCLYVHIVLLCVAIALVLLLPVYTKLLRKIKTSIDVGDNGSMEAIDISGES